LDSNESLVPRFGIRDRIISQLAKTNSDQLDKNGTTNRAFTDGLATALVTHIYRTYSEKVPLDLVKGGLTPIDAQRVLKFIEQNLQENIGLEQLASTVQLSTHYFTEAFRKTVGMPPYRFLLTRRIEKAKDLLLHSDLAPGKIAAEVGFSSQAQFTTNFRKLVGKTPGRFRREAT
jgi:AraC family transcriptional regulator